MPGLRFGPYELPFRAGTEHFLFLGATSSGKTSLISMLFRSAISARNYRTSEFACRALLYDSKGEQKAWAMADRKDVKFSAVRHITPFEEDGLSWDIAADAGDPVAARQIASILIAEPPGLSGDSRFFVQATRDVLTACILLLNERIPGRWDLRDLLLLALDGANLERRLKWGTSFSIKRVTDQYFTKADERTRANVLTTLSADLGVLEPVAAAWSHAKYRYSVATWGKSSDILVLSNEESARSVLDPINRAILARAVETMLSKPDLSHERRDNPDDLTWFFLDEIREAGKMESLRRLLNQGRSKGACVVIGLQDIEGLRSEYQTSQADEMAAQCAHKAVLRLSSPTTADWAAKLFGEQDHVIESEGDSVGGSYTRNRSRKVERKTIVSTAELLHMPNISPESGFSGYYKSPAIDNAKSLADRPYLERIAPWRHAPPDVYTWERTVKPLLSQGKSTTPKKTPPERFVLQGWTAEERAELAGNDGPKQSGGIFFDPAR